VTDWASRRILIAAILERKELVDMLWEAGEDERGDNEYQELRVLAHKLRVVLDDNSAECD
jgi:DNA-binding winged helix-turn-helix (wHTH) protein